MLCCRGRQIPKEGCSLKKKIHFPAAFLNSVPLSIPDKLCSIGVVWMARLRAYLIVHSIFYHLCVSVSPCITGSCGIAFTC
jgi:hypothetical protein